MKFSQQTVDVLKNFSNINESIIIRAGSRLNTTSNARNIMAVAELNDSFPGEAHIYNLGEFLNTLNLFNDPDIEFESTHFVITDDNSTMMYYFADESLIDIPDKVPNSDVLDHVLDFVLTEESLSDLLDASKYLNVPDLVLVGRGGDMVLEARDSKNSTSNKYGKNLGVCPRDGAVDLYFRTENMRLTKGDYNVSVYGRNGKYIANMVHTDMDLNYWIALEPQSSVD